MEGIRDLEGRRIGADDWRPIHADEARIGLTGRDEMVLARERVELPSRYLERWILEGGHLFFEALLDGGFSVESQGPGYLMQLYGADPELRARGMQLSEHDVQSRGDVFYALGNSTDFSCLVFVAVFGEVRFDGSPGDKLIRGGLCEQVSNGRQRGAVPQPARILGGLTVDGRQLLAN